VTETAAPPAARTFANFVGGAWRASGSGATYERRNPARRSESAGVYAASDERDAVAAVDAADGALPAWAGMPAPARGAFLARAARALESRLEEVARDMTREMGKPLREARGEAARGVAILDYFAGEGLRPLGELYQQSVTGGPVYTQRRPLGVVALITPWNFPLAIPLWKAAPALAYGNTVVLKVAQDAPRTGLHVAECFAEAALPPGVLNVLTGEGATAGAALVREPRVAAVSFTGSVAVGKEVREAATSLGKRVQLELGGQNPMLVLADADLGRAVEAAYAGAFWSAGQKCTATRRIFVEEPVYGRFRDAFLARVERGIVGDPSDPATEVGPIVNERQLEGVLAGIERGREEGGTVLAGGGRLGDDSLLVAPTVFEEVGDEAYLSCEEVFGPVVSLYRFSGLEEAIARANAVRYGLSAAIFTNDLRAVQRFVTTLGAGILHVNSQTAGAEVHVPFGGVKGSGFGPHEQGRAAIDFYTEVVTVYHDA
jgi:alpha-ketoglutaric semialdehyde dehydrogenase